MTQHHPGGRVSRRAVLRGAGVALALPWLESLARPARAQAAPPIKRFVAIFFPCGAPDFWKPPVAGAGDAWQLSSVLEPLGPLKSKVTVLSGLELATTFNADGSTSVEPSHGRLPGGWLTCTDPGVVRSNLMVKEANGISVDQVMAAHSVFAGQTALPSLQIGLSSCLSYCDGQPCSNSRNVSWQTPTKPLYKTTDPHQLFNQLAGVWSGSGGAARPLPAERASVLDAVKESTAVLRAKVSGGDQKRLDEFLEAVRSVEKDVVTLAMPQCQPLGGLPNFPVVDANFKDNVMGYNKGLHADLMNRMLALALQCDRTRIVSYMLEDERSEFVCSHIPRRQFGPLTSIASTGVCGEWHGAGQSGDLDTFGSIVHWNVGKVGQLCQQLASMQEDDGQSVLDNSVIFLGAAMHGQDHQGDRLPSVVIGGGGGRLKTDQHLDLGSRPLRDFYYTLMNGVFDMNVTDFGINKANRPIQTIAPMLKV